VQLVPQARRATQDLLEQLVLTPLSKVRLELQDLQARLVLTPLSKVRLELQEQLVDRVFRVRLVPQAQLALTVQLVQQVLQGQTVQLKVRLDLLVQQARLVLRVLVFKSLALTTQLENSRQPSLQAMKARAT
jgi:hypothetical protein